MKVAVALLGYAGSLGLFAVSFFGYAFNRYGSTGIEKDLGSDTVQMLGWLGVGMSLILFVLTAIASAMLEPLVCNAREPQNSRKPPQHSRKPMLRVGASCANKLQRGHLTGLVSDITRTANPDTCGLSAVRGEGLRSDVWILRYNRLIPHCMVIKKDVQKISLLV